MLASVNTDFEELTLVARQMHGPATTLLGSLASLACIGGVDNRIYQ